MQLDFFCKACLAQDDVDLHGRILDAPAPPKSVRCTRRGKAIVESSAGGGESGGDVEVGAARAMLLFAEAAEVKAAEAIEERRVARERAADRAAERSEEASAAARAAEKALQAAKVCHDFRFVVFFFLFFEAFSRDR